MSKVGRPTTYTPELGIKICELVATTSQSIRTICEEEGMPSVSTLFKWLGDGQHKELTEQYARAREMKADFMADEMLEIVDDGSNDFMTITKGDTEYTVENKEWTSRSKIRFEARKWLMSKMMPKKYGDKVDVTSGGEPVATTIQIISPNAGS